MTWAKLANDLELTQNWWMWQKLNQLTLFYLKVEKYYDNSNNNDDNDNDKKKDDT